MNFCVSELKQKGYSVPEFDIARLCDKTNSAPVWLHFGAGNIFRAFIANAWQRALNAGKADTGIIVCESYDTEILDKVYRPTNNLSISVSLKADGTIEKTLLGSVTGSLKSVPEEESDWNALKQCFASPSLQMVSFTVTEKAYAPAAADMDPDHPKSIMGHLAALLNYRFQTCGKPIALVSMDNCSHNGDKLKAGVTATAAAWCGAGLVSEGFRDYLNTSVSFPWTMIDKITPRPDAGVLEMLKKDGLDGLEIIETAKHSFVSQFVNAEETEYLIIEDDFPNGRPDLAAAGFYLTDRSTVDKIERMKVCTCLNPLHTFLAVYGCVLGYTTIHDETNDPDLMRLITRLGKEEGMRVVTDPGILSPDAFLDTVLRVRLPNPFMPDTPQRIATDTSQKLAIRFGETVKAYGKDAASLNVIPLAYAGWFRYLLGETDDGTPFALSPDPKLAAYQDTIDALRATRDAACVKELLHDKALFGCDLAEAGLADKILSDLAEMLKGPGSVRALLQKS